MAETQTTAAGAPATTQEAEASLVDQLLKEMESRGLVEDQERQREQQRNKQFIEEVVRQALAAKPGTVIAGDLERTIKLWQAEIDKKLSVQLNEILHHPDFQRLEGTWRGLDYLVKQSETGDSLKIKVLNATKKTLAKDLEKAVEFDQSTLFKLIYESEYGQAGGKPYGMLVGDYEFSAHPQDIEFLKKMSGVAAAAHAPFVAAAAPQMFGLEGFTELNQPRDLAKIFQSADYTAWKSFRESEDSRYVALTLPRVLSRLPYGAATKPVEEFNYEEGVDGTDHSKYLWMNASWAYATRATDAFAKDGWFMRTRGVESGGKVEGLPVHTFTEDGGRTMKCPTEVLIPDRRENELSELGFLPLLHWKHTDFAAFLGAQTCQKPQKYFEAAANANARLSTNLSYIMCVSRFAHYLKVMAREKIGAMMEAKEVEAWLNRWIGNYILGAPEMAGDDLKARHPLRDARVTVTEDKSKPGWYRAIAHLRPHFQLEGLDVSMRLVANLPPPKS